MMNIGHNLHSTNRGVYMLIGLFVLCMMSCKQTDKEIAALHSTSLGERISVKYKADLYECKTYMDSLLLAQEHDDMERYYQLSRSYFKRLEPIMAFYDAENYKFLNAPNILKVEEEDATSIKIAAPKSFQVLEESIFVENPDLSTIQKAAKLIRSRLALLEQNSDFSHAKPHHMVWMLRDAIMRVSQTGITGFDSPVLEQSLLEGVFVYQSIKEILESVHAEFDNEQLYRKWMDEIDSTISSLQQVDFESFDRYAFIKQHTHPQMRLCNELVTDWNVNFPFTMAIENDATSLFAEDTFNTHFFSDYRNREISQDRIELGKDLFNDVNLSKSKMISCATCHIDSKAFTDGLAKSKGQSRNSPTLTYASLQQAYFYDNRAGSLEGQIVSVVNSDTEFHTDLNTLLNGVKKNRTYQVKFDSLYDGKVDDYNIRNAIASYIRSLNKFNSKFDNNINGFENSLTQNEINGFNLFMGKAKCATCHFAPVFNGTVPTRYKDTELELLGVPEHNDTINASVDPDLGRFYMYETEERKFFFKTPTVRNSELTAPYMHNGVYETLEEVVDFYNRGGGAGIGIDLEYQTLPPDPLDLTIQEQKDLVLFLKTLTDATSKEKIENKVATLR